MSSIPPSRHSRLLASALRRFAASGVIAFSLPALAQPVDPLALDEAVRLATERSSQVVANQAQARAAREKAVAEGQRPDPVLTLGVNNVPVNGSDAWSLTEDFMTMRSIGVMQELTRAGKREARANRAERMADLAQVSERQVAAAVQRDAALAWLDRSFQQSLLELLAAQLVEAERQVQAADALYRSGRGGQADLFTARAEVEQLRDRLDVAQRAVTVATTQLARWIGAAAQQPLAARPEFALPAWTAGDLAQHVEQHPQIATSRQQEAVAQAEAELARANKSADWSVALMYSQRGPSYSNMVSLNFSVPLQWDQKQRQDRELAAALALTERAAAETEDITRAHLADVRAMLEEWRSDRQRLARYDASRVPLAVQRVDAALTAYRSGTGGLPSVLEARRAEIDVRVDRLRIEMNLARLWAQLNFLVPAGGLDPARIAVRSQP
jgi:outer membrane protein TolC